MLLAWLLPVAIGHDKCVKCTQQLSVDLILMCIIVGAELHIFTTDVITGSFFSEVYYVLSKSYPFELKSFTFGYQACQANFDSSMPMALSDIPTTVRSQAQQNGDLEMGKP